MSSWQEREVCLVVDFGYYTENRPRGADGKPRIVEFTIRAKANDRIADRLSEELCKAGFDGAGRLATVSLLPPGVGTERYLFDGSVAQSIDFAYGLYGELYRFQLPYAAPTNMTFGQLQNMADRHFAGFSSATIVVRAQGGFGGGGGASTLVESLLEWLRDESASYIFGAALTWLVAKFKKLIPMMPSRRRSRRYAQVARDMVSRNLFGVYELDCWLGLSPVWTTEDITVALVLPRRLASKLLRRAGYTRLGWTSRWTLGRTGKAKDLRRTWEQEASKRYGWSTLG